MRKNSFRTLAGSASPNWGFALLIVVLALTIPEQAISAMLTASASVTLSGVSDAGTFPTPCMDSTTGTAGSATAVCNQSFDFTNGGTPNFTQGRSEAFATYGVLQATSQVITSTFFASPTGTAGASFADDILLSGATTATMIHIVFLESHLGSVALDQVREFVNGALCAPGSCTAPATLGVSIALRGEVQTGAFTPGQGGPNSAALSLSRLELLNSMGNPISATGVTYTTGSGTAYNFPGATFVPEPGGLTLLAGPLAGLLLMRFRRCVR